MVFPPSIPALPLRVTPWPVNLLAAYDTLAEIYQHALRAWDQEDADPLRLNYHLGSLDNDGKQLLLAIEEDPIGSELAEWLIQSAELIVQLYVSITSYRDSIQKQYVHEKNPFAGADTQLVSG